jgi:hypothetical protein
VTTRIALAGAHETGKSTLAAELARALPGHPVVEEPYYELEAEGHLFAAPPTLEDFEAQLERSLRNVREERGDVIFDRSPADYLAYMLAHRDAADADVSSWLPRVADAVATLDLTVFVRSSGRTGSQRSGRRGGSAGGWTPRSAPPSWATNGDSARMSWRSQARPASARGRCWLASPPSNRTSTPLHSDAFHSPRPKGRGSTTLLFSAAMVFSVAGRVPTGTVFVHVDHDPRKGEDPWPAGSN